MAQTGLELAVLLPQPPQQLCGGTFHLFVHPQITGSPLSLSGDRELRVADICVRSGCCFGAGGGIEGGPGTAAPVLDTSSFSLEAVPSSGTAGWGGMTASCSSGPSRNCHAVLRVDSGCLVPETCRMRPHVTQRYTLSTWQGQGCGRCQCMQ